MNWTDHYYFLFLTNLSSKLGDVSFLLISILWYTLIWEVRTYHSDNIVKRSECERILEKITKEYWFCTNHRTHIKKELIPTGFILGDGFFMAYIHVHKHMSTGNNNHLQHKKSLYGETITYEITLYGWWTTQRLLTNEIVNSKQEKGEYQIIRCLDESNFVRTSDDFQEEHFHQNCTYTAREIIKNYEKNNFGVYFLYGAPGLGKTTTARKLAKHMNARICFDLEECIRYDDSLLSSFESLYHYIQPDNMRPLIIIIDELEDFLFVTHEKQYCEPIPHDDKPLFRNRNTKKKWVRWMDAIQQVKNVILLLTSNKPKSYFDDIDPALLREYRVSKCFHYQTDGVEEVPFKQCDMKQSDTKQSDMKQSDTKQSDTKQSDTKQSDETQTNTKNKKKKQSKQKM